MLSSAKEVYVSQTNEGPYVPVLLLAGKLVDPEIVIFEPFHYIFCKKTDSIPFFSRFLKIWRVNVILSKMYVSFHNVSFSTQR